MKQRSMIAGVAAALMVASASAVWAQDSTAGTGMSDSTGTMPMAMPAPLPMPQQMNYKILLNQPFTYLDLQQAKYSGLSDDQVAAIAQIAQRTGQSFDTVRGQVLNGATYPMLAEKYNMNLGSLYNVRREERKIRAYKAAYRTTGYYAMKSMAMQNMGMSSGMSSGDMSSSDTGTMDSMNSPAAPMANGDIVSVAMSMPQLSTFVKAVQAAGLVSDLQGPGPFTVFAPNNAAFKHLPKGALKGLMANPTQLMQVLEYHVIQGQSIDAAAAMSMTSPTSPATMQGGTLNVTTRRGHVMINNARVVKANIQATNGIIHVINKVLMPPASTGATMPAP